MAKSDLELLIENTIPDSLKANETISSLLALYLDSFDEMRDLLDNPLNILDTDFLIKKYEESNNKGFDDVRKELFKIHLEEIYRTFDEIDDSEEIYNKFKFIYESLDIPTEDLKIVADIDDSINSEYLNAASSFKTKKGTRSGFFFVYDIVNRAGIQAINADKFFKLIEGTEENPETPYEYTVETSLYKEVFDKTIIPLAHPVGFNWNFIRLLFLTLEDYFGLEQSKTLDEATLTCYGLSDATINQIEIVNSGIYGLLKNYESILDKDKNEELILDYYPLDGTEGNGLRLVRQFDGRVILYDRQNIKIIDEDNTQYLEITDVRLVNNQNGLLTLNKINRTLFEETFEVVESIDFREYTIIDKDFVNIEFKIKGDKEEVWNRSRLYLDNKVVSADIKFYEPINFTRDNIFEACGSYNGRIVEDKGNNCQVHYKVTYSYTIITKDISPYIEERRPLSLDLSKTTDDIIITPAEIADAIAEGRDPYKGLYSSHDHTIEEQNWYGNSDFWGRLAPGNKSAQPFIGQEDLYIGGDWLITDEALHIFDIGFNPNVPGGRWENYYRPDSEEDLALVNSTNTIARYERDNTEWEDIANSNNNNYSAWEDYSMDISIVMFKDQKMCLDNHGEPWYIGDDQTIGDCLFIDSAGDGVLVDAEIYRNIWNSDSSVSYENYSTKYIHTIIDEAKILEPAYYDKDNEYKFAADAGESYIDNKKIDENYSYKGYNEPIISDDEGICFNIGDEGIRIGNVQDMVDDEWDFGVYRYNEVLGEWELLEDNNISNAA